MVARALATDSATTASRFGGEVRACPGGVGSGLVCASGAVRANPPKTAGGGKAVEEVAAWVLRLWRWGSSGDPGE